MENGIINVLIVDDEPMIRQGIRYTLDWQSLGFCICGEAGTGEEAIEKIRKYKPDLVLLDIRMPRMYGTELMEIVRANGYQGYFIILSGYSDFEYAQKALHCGASFYLTKPIDEAELQHAVLSVKEEIIKKHQEQHSRKQYVDKAKKSILHELFKSDTFDSSINYTELGLTSYIYQVVIYESYTPYYTTYSFADILRVANHGNSAFEYIVLDNQNIILLKGDSAIEKFEGCLSHYRRGTEKGSPLDILFLAYSPTISSLSEIHEAYEICRRLMQRRFFCQENQHVLSYADLPVQTSSPLPLNSAFAKSYSDKLVQLIQSFNRRRIAETLQEISDSLYISPEPIDAIKYFLIDIFLQIKQSVSNNYSTIEIPFAHNASIIETLTNMYHLYEILAYFQEQFEMIMRAIGNNSSESVLDDILYYINHNYQESIKLESLSNLFGYNTSYLGKLFKEHVGQNFNSYLDSVRIKQATILLDTTDLRVYEVSARVGYKNVDYFQQKFRKITGINPSEYRLNK